MWHFFNVFLSVGVREVTVDPLSMETLARRPQQADEVQKGPGMVGLIWVDGCWYVPPQN